MTYPRNTAFGAATYTSATAMLLLIAVAAVLPFGGGPTPVWAWTGPAAGAALCGVSLIAGGRARRIAVGVVVAVLTPILLLLALPVIAVAAKALGSLVG